MNEPRHVVYLVVTERDDGEGALAPFGAFDSEDEAQRVLAVLERERRHETLKLHWLPLYSTAEEWEAEWAELSISRLLLKHWDVIGVADLDVVPEREYMYQAQHLLRALNAGAGERNITNLLAELGRDVRAPENRERDARAAQAVIAWYRSIA